jgi:hypothetical protein
MICFHDFFFNIFYFFFKIKEGMILQSVEMPLAFP